MRSRPACSCYRNFQRPPSALVVSSPLASASLRVWARSLAPFVPPQALRTFPSANLTSSRCATGLPLLTGSTVIVTWSPGFSEVLLQPAFTMSGGLLVSAIQCTLLPSSPLTSYCRKQCGLAQNHSVTVPFMVSCLPTSNAALP